MSAANCQRPSGPTRACPNGFPPTSTCTVDPGSPSPSNVTEPVVRLAVSRLGSSAGARTATAATVTLIGSAVATTRPRSSNTSSANV